MDWNNDGKKDLILGERDGHVRIYINQNTDADPVFNGYSYLQMGGVDYVPDSTVVPFVVDWDEDGKKDVIIGTEIGYIYLLINEGTNASPLYNSATRLQESGVDLIVYPLCRSAPVVSDWNRDGKKDLIVGCSLGNLYFFENVGTHANPVFDGHEKLKAGGADILVGMGYSRAWPVDWDEDGITDLIAGCWFAGVPSKGYIYFYRAFDAMTADVHTLSAATGGSVKFKLEAGVNNAKRNYILLGGVTGTYPGTGLPGGYATLPINWDPFTDLVMLFLNSLLFENFLSQLDTDGVSNAKLNSPPLPSSAIGVMMHYAYALNNPFDFASNATDVKIQP